MRGTRGVKRRSDKDMSRLSGVVVNSLDGNATTGELAKQAYQSRTQFYRLFPALVEEIPAAMRRRLLLERARHTSPIPLLPKSVEIS